MGVVVVVVDIGLIAASIVAVTAPSVGNHPAPNHIPNLTFTIMTGNNTNGDMINVGEDLFGLVDMVVV